MSPEDLIDAIDEFFGDTSRSPSETREGLERAVDHAQLLISSLPEADGDEEDNLGGFNLEEDEEEEAEC